MTEPLVQSAAQAFDRYQAYLDQDRLIQAGWHKQADDGRQLACALGVLGGEVESPSECPAAVMPRWLAQMTPWFFDNMAFDDAKAWGLAFYAELKRLDGHVPFSVVYDWEANYTTALAIEVSQKHGWPVEPHKALQDLHRRALAGDWAPEEQWRTAYAHASASAYAYASASASAYAYAYAYAYASASASAYAEDRARRYGQLAHGMVECLRRVPTPSASKPDVVPA